MTNTVHLCYYASLREAAGVAEESLVSAAPTAAALYDEVTRLHGLREGRASLRVAVNDRIVPWDTRIADGDTVVFLPPFAGG
jgi:sulfur-carrier protein